MKKMKLALEHLQVESFAVHPEMADARGTVEGLAEASRVHSGCYTHCATDCEDTCTCPSNGPTHCWADPTCFDCGSDDGGLETMNCTIDES